MNTTAAEYARHIMTAINADIRDGILPATVGSFEDLHDYVDANDYLDAADVPCTPDSNDLVADIQEAVTALLTARQ